MKALMIDDDPLARSWIQTILRHHVSELLVAEDGEQAWQLLQAGARPAVCFCDVAMPGVDGLELLRRVRDEPLLGLYRCGRLMALAGTEGLSAERGRVLLRECAALVEDQLREMGALSPVRTVASTDQGR